MLLILVLQVHLTIKKTSRCVMDLLKKTVSSVQLFSQPIVDTFPNKNHRERDQMLKNIMIERFSCNVGLVLLLPLIFLAWLASVNKSMNTIVNCAPTCILSFYAHVPTLLIYLNQFYYFQFCSVR